MLLLLYGRYFPDNSPGRRLPFGVLRYNPHQWHPNEPGDHLHRMRSVGRAEWPYEWSGAVCAKPERRETNACLYSASDVEREGKSFLGALRIRMLVTHEQYSAQRRTARIAQTAVSAGRCIDQAVQPTDSLARSPKWGNTLLWFGQSRLVYESVGTCPTSPAPRLFAPDTYRA